MRRFIRSCLAVFVSGFCLLAVQAGDADKDALRYDGKPFEYWRTYMRTELKSERRIDALRALAAFGVRGHAHKAANVIVEVVKDYGEDAYGGDEKDATPDQKVIREAKEAVVKIGPAAFEVVLQKANDSKVRRFAEWVYSAWWENKQIDVCSVAAVRTLLEFVQGNQAEVRVFAVEMLGGVIRRHPPSKENVITVLRDKKDTE